MKPLDAPARLKNASTCPVTRELGPGTVTYDFQTQGCEHVGLWPCLIS